MAGVDAALHRLQPVALLQPLRGMPLRLGQERPLQSRQRRFLAAAPCRSRPHRRAPHTGKRAGTRSLNVLASGSLGMSTHAPETSNFQPWYTHRRPQSSLRPKYSDAPRWGQCSSTSASRPAVSRKATNRSPSSVTRTGARSASATSHANGAGIQYRRIKRPIAVPGPASVTQRIL